MRRFLCDHLHHPEGWLSPGVLEVDDDGIIRSAGPAGADKPDIAVEHLRGFVVPGLANLHSHAFQRAMAGLTECMAPGQADSFWTWRSAMYDFAASMTPDDLQAVAAQLYVEMLEAGMTAVGEFHYLHHDRNGTPYADPAQMSQRVIAAAQETGIALTLLPVFFAHGGFDAPAEDKQRRFVHDSVDDFLETLRGAIAATKNQPNARIGVAPHSLRAVSHRQLRALASAVHELDERAPIHIHIAEQLREVEEAQVHLGDRPVAWLLNNLDVDARWCLIHATHLTAEERTELAASSAVVGLCPTTEANLGDGIFPAAEFIREGGTFGIGSDSHISVSITEELRLLEYGQRLIGLRRNLISGESRPIDRHVGRFAFDRALRGGAQALDQPMGALTPGRRADLVLLDQEHPRLLGHNPQTVLDAWIFGGADRGVRAVMVGGRWVVQDGRHVAAEAIRTRFAQAQARLRSGA